MLAGSVIRWSLIPGMTHTLREVILDLLKGDRLFNIMLGVLHNPHVNEEIRKGKRTKRMSSLTKLR